MAVSDMEASPLSFSMIGCSPLACRVCPVNSGGGSAEFSGMTSNADWRCAASSARGLAATAASASSSFLWAEAAAFLASAFSRRAASSSSRFSCAFRSVASRRSAAGSILRVLAEVSADPMTEAAATRSRERGALKKEGRAET